MNKLTTDRLETIATWREKYGNGANVMIPAEEAELMARQLLAYEQAAKNPVAWTDSDELEDANKGYSAYLFALDGEANKYADPRRKIMLYAAPVLPKQPELVVLTDEQIDAVLDSKANMAYIISDKRERLRMFAREIIRTAMISTAPAQPVIPEQPEFYTKPDRFLPECLKPEEISGGRRNSRIAELMGWFDRYYSGKANPKWLKAHVAELCYYILTVPQLSAQPVSEPYKLHQGWIKGQFAYQDLFKAIGGGR